MLVIRKTQLDALGAHVTRRFENRLVDHLRRSFPGQTASETDEGLRSICSYGRERARHHGFRSQRDICRYINLMLVFGRDFDRDPRHPWARRTLAKKGLGPTLLMSRLHAAALRHEQDGHGVGHRDAERG